MFSSCLLWRFSLGPLQPLLLLPLCFRRRLLLIRHCAAPRSLTGAGVGMRAVASNRQAAPMPQAAVGAHLDVTLDVHRDFLAQVAFHGSLFFEDLANGADFIFAQIAYLFVKINPRAKQQRLRTSAPDAINIAESDFDSLLRPQIYSGDTYH